MGPDEVAELLRKRIEADHGCIKRAAWKLETDYANLRKTITGERLPSKKVLKYLGLKKVVSYEPL